MSPPEGAARLSEMVIGTPANGGLKAPGISHWKTLRLLKEIALKFRWNQRCFAQSDQHRPESDFVSMRFRISVFPKIGTPMKIRARNVPSGS